MSRGFAAANPFAALGNDGDGEDGSGGWEMTRKQKKKQKRAARSKPQSSAATPNRQQQPQAPARSGVAQPPMEHQENYAPNGNRPANGKPQNGKPRRPEPQHQQRPPAYSQNNSVWYQIRKNIIAEVVERGYEHDLVTRTLENLEKQGKIKEIRNSKNRHEVMTMAKLVLENAGREQMKVKMANIMNDDEEEDGNSSDDAEEDQEAADQNGWTQHAAPQKPPAQSQSSPPAAVEPLSPSTEQEDDADEDDEGSEADQTAGTASPLPAESEPTSPVIEPSALSAKDRLIRELRDWDPTRKDSVFILDSWRKKLSNQSDMHREFAETFFKHNGLEEIVKKVCQGNVDTAVDRACVGLMEEVMYGQRASSGYTRTSSYHMWLYNKIRDIAHQMTRGDDEGEIDETREFVVNQCLLKILQVQKKMPSSLRQSHPETSPLVQQPKTERGPSDPAAVLWKKVSRAGDSMTEVYNKMKAHEREVKRVAPTSQEYFKRTYSQVLENVDQKIKRIQIEASQQHSSVNQVDRKLQMLSDDYQNKIGPLSAQLDDVRTNKTQFEMKKIALERQVADLEAQIERMSKEEGQFTAQMKAVEESIKPKQDGLQKLRKEFDFKLTSLSWTQRIYDAMRELVRQSYDHLDEWSRAQVSNQGQVLETIGANFAQKVVEYITDQSALLDFISQRIKFLKNKMEEARSEEAEYRRLGVEAPHQNKSWLENLGVTITDDERNIQSILGSINAVLNKAFQALTETTNVVSANNLYLTLAQSPITRYPINLERFNTQLQFLNHQRRQQQAQQAQEMLSHNQPFHQAPSPQTAPVAVAPGPRHGGPTQQQPRQAPLTIVQDNPNYNLSSQPSGPPVANGRRPPVSSNARPGGPRAAPIAPPTQVPIVTPTSQAPVAGPMPSMPPQRRGPNGAVAGPVPPQKQTQPASGPIPVLRAPAQPTRGPQASLPSPHRAPAPSNRATGGMDATLNQPPRETPPQSSTPKQNKQRSPRRGGRRGRGSGPRGPNGNPRGQASQSNDQQRSLGGMDDLIAQNSPREQQHSQPNNQRPHNTSTPPIGTKKRGEVRIATATPVLSEAAATQIPPGPKAAALPSAKMSWASRIGSGPSGARPPARAVPPQAQNVNPAVAAPAKQDALPQRKNDRRRRGGAGRGRSRAPMSSGGGGRSYH